jgi:alkylation response protein AidB-like acyl-CoA dehydrogenase
MYDLLPSDEETMIADSVRGFLERELPLERLRPGAKPLDLAQAWQGMADLGWFGTGLPEAAGGAGMSLVAEMLIQRGCGRHLASPVVLSTVLAGHVAHCAGDAATARNFAAGSRRAALAIDTATKADGHRRRIMAIDWNRKDPLLYWNESGMGLFAASAFACPGEAACVDDSVTLHAGELDLAKASTWVETGRADLPRRADVLLASALDGLAEHACDLAVAYAKVREQFGKPIGAFQAIKHRCADMAVRQRLAWRQCCMAALTLQAGASDAPLQVASAKLLAAEAARENGRACIQIHGGIGFQSECDAHWFVKRAFVYDQAGGAMQAQAERVIVQPRPEW